MEVKENDLFEFKDNDKNIKFYAKDIWIKSFENKIWRSGFIYGCMTGSAIILLILGAVITNPYLK